MNKEEFEKRFCLKYSSLNNGRTVWISEDTPEAVWNWFQQQVSVEPQVMQKIAKRLSEEQREKKLMSENLVLLDLGKAERLKGYLAGIERAIHIMIDVDSNFKKGTKK